MPSLEEILKKTKSKSDLIKMVRQPPSIATEDRPYSIPEIKSILPSESGNKVATNWQQNQDKIETNLRQINKETEKKWQQSSNKVATEVETKKQQSSNNLDHENQKWQQSSNGTSNNIYNKVATNLKQSSNKVATITVFSELVGLQRDIIIFISQECKNSRSRITGSLTLEYISMCLKHSSGTIRTTIQRLEKKGCLIRVGFKNGRGGWSQYEIPDHIYHEVLRNESGNKVATNLKQSSNKVATELATELATTTLSSSSFKNITTTELPAEWNFDITPYTRFGFTSTQIKQLSSLGSISASDVEQSLIEFNFDLDNNSLPPMKTSKLNFLMGLLRKGNSYVSEGYQNDQDRAAKEMARRLAVKKENALQDKFDAWEANLNSEERKKIIGTLPTHLLVTEKTYGSTHKDIRKWMFDYFMNHFTLDPK